MKVIFVRHCDADWSGGATDPGLSELGRWQAAATAAELASRVTPATAGSVIWSGPTRRARETAGAIASALGGVTVAVDPDLDGLSDRDLRRRLTDRVLDAELLALLADRQERAVTAIDRIREQQDGPTDAIVVTHDAVIGPLICRVLSMALTDLDRFSVDLGSISALDFRPQRTILAALNDACHLDGIKTP